MQLNQVYSLVHPEARKRAVAAVTGAPDGFVVRITPGSRNLEQNALLHAILSEISTLVEWHGQHLSVDVWKRLCTAAWLRECGESPTMIPALDGKGFDVIFERTSSLTVAQCSDLIEWCRAFAVEHMHPLENEKQ